jgi:hypothetical protein
MAMKRVGFGLSVVVLAACMGPAGGAPEASAPEAVETRPDAAVLTGAISMVDGKPADGGAPIYLPAGCHTLRTSSDFMTSPTPGVTVRATITPVNFALVMNAGSNYWVERKILDTVDSSSRVRFTVYERDASGTVKTTYQPLTADAANAFCASAK